jgi:hypothetical protein
MLPPDMPLPDMDPELLEPDIPPPLMLLRDRDEWWRRLWCLVLRVVLPPALPVVPGCAVVLEPLLAPVLPAPVEPVPPVVCAEAATGRTAMVASVAMRFRMIIASELLELLGPLDLPSCAGPRAYGGARRRHKRVAFHRHRARRICCSPDPNRAVESRAR